MRTSAREANHIDNLKTAAHTARPMEGTTMPIGKNMTHWWLRAAMTKARKRAQEIDGKWGGYGVSAERQKAVKLAKEYLAATNHFYE